MIFIFVVRFHLLNIFCLSRTDGTFGAMFPGPVHEPLELIAHLLFRHALGYEGGTGEHKEEHRAATPDVGFGAVDRHSDSGTRGPKG